eukprot:s234_g31.t1
MAVTLLQLALLCLAAQASKDSKLIDAVKRGHLGEVQELLKDGADVDQTDDHLGLTPLMWAAARNSTEMVKAILAENPEMDFQNKVGWSALIAAARYGSTEMVKAILAEHPNIELRKTDGWSALMEAARYGSTEMVKAILAENPEIDLQNKVGWSALMEAARYGSTERVKAILAENPEIDQEEIEGWSVLMLAARYGSTEMVKAILAKNPKTDLQNKEGSSALMIAAHSGSTEVVKAILAKKAKVDVQDKLGWSALMIAARFGSTDMVKAILAENPEMDVQNKDGWSALMEAARYGSTDMVKAILAENPEMDFRNKDGRSALMYAAQYGSTDMVKAILAKNPEMDFQNKDGWSALMIAAFYGSTEMVKAILAKKPKVDLETRSGGTALGIAAEQGLAPKVSLLLAANASIDHQDLGGGTALFRAAERGQFQTVGLLLDHGARPEVVARNGQTALQVAMQAPDFINAATIVETLQKHTPTGWALLQTRVASPRLWKLMGIAVTAGVFSGLVWYWAFGELLASSHGSPGARRVALKAIAKQPLRHKGFRALEVMASIYLPLGVAFLWIDWKILLPVYMGMYILPRAYEVGRRGLQHPILVLVGVKRGTGLCDSRAPRVIATAVFLALAFLMPMECSEEINYYIFGDATVECKGPLAAMMVRGTSFVPRMLSLASSTFLCPRQNPMAPWLKWTYFGFAGCTVLGSALWLMLTVAEMLGVIIPGVALSPEDKESAQQLEAMLVRTSTPEEVNTTSHGGVTAQAEKDCVWCIPGGTGDWDGGLAWIHKG